MVFHLTNALFEADLISLHRYMFQQPVDGLDTLVEHAERSTLFFTKIFGFLKELMIKKEVVGDALNQLRLAKQRASFEGMPEGVSEDELNSTLAQLLIVLEYLDGASGEPPISEK